MKAIVVTCFVGCIMAVWFVPCIEAQKDEAAVKAEFDRQVALFIKTTEQDIKSEHRLGFRNPSVDLLSASMEKTNSLIAPYEGRVNYMVEHDNPLDKSTRLTHPYLLTCKYVGGRWNIDPHAHMLKKDVTDLEPKKPDILFPNI